MERFWQTEEWLKYLLNSKIGVELKDHSFFIDNKFVPLIQEGQEFYSPGFEDNKKILAAVKELALKHNIKRIQVDSQIKSYLNISGYTCILDLDNIKPSKGHKSAINKGNKYLRYIMNYDINDFKADYFKIAGKKTRPDKTFEILDKWRNENGILLTALLDGQVAGHIYVLYYKNWAYYFMGCTENEYKKYGVSHFLIWNAIELLRKLEIQFFEMGEQPQNNLYNCPTEKEKNIALFKRSFGGNIVNNPISEYFFDKDYFMKTMNKRLKKYIENEYEK
jgi:hypothetical protein